MTLLRLAHPPGGATDRSAGACVVAYYHHPRYYATGYANGSHRSNTSSEPLWFALADAGADLVMNGRGHQYERLSPNRGITEVIVGGTGLNDFGQPIAGSVVRNATTHGVLKGTLNAGGYNGQFVPIAGLSPIRSADPANRRSRR